MVLGRGRDGGLMIMSFNSGGGRRKKRLGQTAVAGGATMPLMRTQCLTLTWAMEVERAMVVEVDTTWPCRSLGL